MSQAPSPPPADPARDARTVGAAARFLDAGDRAFVVEFGSGIDRAVNARVVRTAERVRESALPGVAEVTATFRSLMVRYDPLVTSRAALEAAVAALPLDPPGAARRRRVWRIPALYGGAGGPDIAGVAEAVGTDTAEVARLHAEPLYHVYMMGFLPGFPYLGEVAEPLRLPRLATPRLALPPGSIAIALAMTAVYPVQSPGGWRLIGHTPVRLFDPAAPSPCLLAAGDAVRFEAVDAAEHARVAAAVARGEHALEAEIEEAPA